MDFVAEVKDYIEASLAGSEAELEVTSGGRVVGKVLWQEFENQDLIERQQSVWTLLKNHFQARATEIGVLLTYTPGEIRAMRSA